VPESGRHRWLYLSIALAVFLAEGLQFFRLVDRLGIPKTGLLGVVLGSRFSVSNLIMYILGGAAAFTLDRYLLLRVGWPGQRQF